MEDSATYFEKARQEMIGRAKRLDAARNARRHVGDDRVLRALLSYSQWEDWKRYESFREIAHFKSGLPACLMEFGSGYQGFIQFDKRDWSWPRWWRNMYLVHTGSRQYTQVDLISGVLTYVRLFRFERIEKEGFACFQDVQLDDRRKIMNRTWHKDSRKWS